MDRSPRPRPHDSTAGRLAALAALLADETRASFCLALLDGRAWTAGELARYAGVAPSTASEHLGRLVAGGLLAGQPDIAVTALPFLGEQPARD
ncbi:winged helix-turn-helix domain-containing protein, partial [Streptomyces sp. MBT60]|uniref:winged helix-turn-helix domain-containing protein n=1 Tax=Streptomyces sp. MBT60 TaxID=2800409 RepID=UPI00190D1700